MPHHHHHHSHGHHHHHHHDDSCCCCCHGEVCEVESHEHPEGSDFAAELLALADEAWMEVLKDKIKETILKMHGKHLDKLAQLVSESNKERWKFKMAKEKACNDYQSQLDKFFYQEK